MIPTMEKNSYQIEINKLIEVGNFIYKQLGHGCQEHVYKEVLELELELRNIPYSFRIKEHENVPDERKQIVCFDKIIVGLDTHSFLSEEQENTFMKSLEDIDSPIGLLFNFGYKNLQFIKVGGQCVLQ
ncbi:GxxExxY protein [Ancylomarina euxinus]|uniref:GxxExxY protein n=2 Tax=Ancylomarina euxinus TaxID=2283627 RepID=A0A425Y6G4_9BACT|nr:GxxExxY protein [Ancylomarina euxinus]RRG24103.1 GxxExxY protein [Ancylomarina euxinus]